MEQSPNDSPRPVLLSLRSFLESESSEPAPAAPMSPESTAEIPQQHTLEPTEDWPEDLGQIVVEEQQLSGEEPRDLMVVQRLPEGALKRMSESQSQEVLGLGSCATSPAATLRLTLKPPDLPEILLSEEAAESSRPSSSPKQQFAEPAAAETDDEAPTPPACLPLAPPSLATLGPEDLKSLISPQVHAVLVDSSKFTFGPRATSLESSQADIQSLVLEDPAPEEPETRKKERPEIPRLNLELLQLNNPSNRLVHLTYSQCLHLLSGEGDKESSLSSEPKRPGCMQRLWQCCRGGSREPAEIQAQCRLLLALDKRPVGDGEVDRRLLYSVWRQLRPGRNYANPSEEWATVGFRTKDPRTEASTLVLLQLLFLTSERSAYATRLLEVSKKRGTAFPFAEECIAAVSLALKVLKSGALAAVIRETKDASATFSLFFLGCLDAWLHEHMRSPGYVDRAMLETSVSRNPRAVVQHAQSNVQ